MEREMLTNEALPKTARKDRVSAGRERTGERACVRGREKVAEEEEEEE